MMQSLDCPDCKAAAATVNVARIEDLLAFSVRCTACGAKLKYVPREVKVRKLRAIDGKQKRLA